MSAENHTIDDYALIANRARIMAELLAVAPPDANLEASTRSEAFDFIIDDIRSLERIAADLMS